MKTTDFSNIYLPKYTLTAALCFRLNIIKITYIEILWLFLVSYILKRVTETILYLKFKLNYNT